MQVQDSIFCPALAKKFLTVRTNHSEKEIDK